MKVPNVVLLFFSNLKYYQIMTIIKISLHKKIKNATLTPSSDKNRQFSILQKVTFEDSLNNQKLYGFTCLRPVQACSFSCSFKYQVRVEMSTACKCKSLILHERANLTNVPCYKVLLHCPQGACTSKIFTGQIP